MQDSPDTIITQATELMLLGMGTVFVFLGVLILATSLMSRVVRRLAPPAPAVVPKSKARPQAVPPEIRTAIELAIRQYKKHHR